jgi:hypothetical protein
MRHPRAFVIGRKAVDHGPHGEKVVVQGGFVSSLDDTLNARQRERN